MAPAAPAAPVTLADLIQQSRFATPAHEALLNVLATASYAAAEMADTLAPFGVTQAQYNVLRILRGRHPECHTCTSVGERLIDRTPDVTRLLARLEARGLVVRQRAEYDRRVVEVAITAEGLALLDRLDGPVEATIARLTGHLSAEDQQVLSGLLERFRTDQN